MMGLPGPWVPDFNYQNFDINKKKLLMYGIIYYVLMWVIV